MASIYQRKDSRYFWIQYRDKSGRQRYESTECRVGVAPDVRRARQLAAQKTIEEMSTEAPATNWDWVPGFLSVRYRKAPLTHERYLCAWSTTQLFLKEKEIVFPSQLLRQHCYDYIDWRGKAEPKNGKYKAGHNTALLELKVLRIIMREAVKRGLTQANPCVELGVTAEPRGKLKPEFSDADYDFIHSQIPDVPDPIVRHMLATSLEVARYQGCRLNETRLDLDHDIDLANRVIRFKAKRGKIFETVLHPKLVPLLSRLKSEGRRYTWEPPQGFCRTWAAAKWAKLMNRVDVKARLGPGACFHSTRVTVVTRMARAEVPLTKAKAYVGHSSTTVHEVYLRFRHDDLKGCTDAI